MAWATVIAQGLSFLLGVWYLRRPRLAVLRIRLIGMRFDARWNSARMDVPETERENNIETALGLSWVLGGGPPRDTDGDGVPDRKDDCPDTPRGATVDEKGCPSDSDGDGVLNGLDKCPDTPKGDRVGPHGCSCDVSRQVQFAFDSAELTDAGKTTLDRGFLRALGHAGAVRG